MRQVVREYMLLANFDVSQYKSARALGTKVALPRSMAALRDKKHVAVLTAAISADSTAPPPKIHSFESEFTLVGGVNMPKIVVCIGSDGVRYKQLVKGRDDLRQDAVMQQMFSVVSMLLSQNEESRKRRLNVRTYKVVPLSPRSGVLQWVQNTIPLGDYLIGQPTYEQGASHCSCLLNVTRCVTARSLLLDRMESRSAHCRYRPQDKLSIECRELLDQAPSSSKLQVYKQICSKHFKPVFHHFFVETYATAAEWFEKRITYTKSAASSSMVGYIVGLGDRHLQNILIDRQSAELVHIDLGIAFEQGKMLKTPEIVPFRLTRGMQAIARIHRHHHRSCDAHSLIARSLQISSTAWESRATRECFVGAAKRPFGCCARSKRRS